MDTETDTRYPLRATRDSIKDIWGPRTPYKHVWPTRADELVMEEPEKWVQSACVLCSNGCGMDIGVKNNKIVGVRGRVVDRVNHGRLGPKGMHSWVSNSHKDRLTHPLIRKNGKLEQASWDEAMSLIVDKSKDIVERLTAHGVGFYTSGQLFLEEYYALALFGKGGLGTLHMDGNTRLCTATAAASMRESFGSDGQPGSYTDIDVTDCIFMVGHNMSATQTVLWARILDRLAGDKPPSLIVVDPRLSNSAKKATVHLAPRIGTNMALLNGIEHLLFENGWINEEWCTKHVVGLEALKLKVKKYNPELVEEITGVPSATLRKAAEIIGRTESLLSTCLQGVYQSNQATASACQVNNINLLKGCIGKSGSGIFQMNGQPTAQNNRETGCDGEFPGFRNNANKAQMQELADIWNIDLQRVPHWNQPTHIESMLNFIEAGSMEMFWVSGTNPLVSLPNLPRLRKLFTKPELFLICQDIFLTETAQIADVVLPAAQWGEKTGCFTNVDRTVHISHKAIDPPGEAKSDFEIFVDYGKRMNFRDKDDQPLMRFGTPEEAFEEWKKVSRGRPCDYSGLTYEKLTGGSGIQWPCNEEHPHGKERLFEDGVFFTDMDYCESFGHDLETGAQITADEYRVMNPAGRAILKVADYHPALDATDHDYPFQLSTGRRTFHFHTRTKTGRSKALQDACPEPVVEVNSDDAEQLGVVDGEMVVIRSRRGAIELKVLVTKIERGQLFVPFHFGTFDAQDSRARAANELTQEQWDPISKQPMLKSGAVRIEKIQHSSDGEVTIHAREGQSDAIKQVEERKANATESGDSRRRDRHLEYWLGALFESLRVLTDIWSRLVPRLVSDLEIVAGVRQMGRMTEGVLDQLRPQIEKYGENEAYGQEISGKLRDTLFRDQDCVRSSYEALVTLQALHVYLAHIAGLTAGLQPAAQAVWDHELSAAVQHAENEVKRMSAFVSIQMKTRSPQTLIVPSIAEGESECWKRNHKSGVD